MVDLEDLGTADDALEGQKSLGYCRLNGFDETFATQHPVTARQSLDDGRRGQANDALKTRS